MNAQQAQQFLRQQISYAGILLKQAELEARLPAQRAFMQGAIMGLGLGLERYVSQALGLANFGSGQALTPTSLATSVQTTDGHNSAKQNELLSLLAEDGWVYDLSQLYVSTQQLPNASAASEPSSLLIASSRQAPNRHWSQLTLDEVRDYLAKTEELVDRHGSADQEW